MLEPRDSTVRPPRCVAVFLVLASLLCAGTLCAGSVGAATLGGTVTAAGAPVEGARVTVLGPTTTAGIAITDDSGAWRLEGLAAGSYVVTAEADGLATEAWPDAACFEALCDPRTVGQEIVVAAADERLDVDFTLAAAAAIEGTVRAVTGEPLAVDIRLYDDSLDAWATVTSTAADGSFRIDGLGAGVYRVATDGAVGFVDELFDDVPCPEQACDAADGTAIALVAGATVDDVDFVLGAEGRISGRVTRAASGEPVTAGAVRVFSLDGAELLFAPVVGGVYEVGPLPSGSYYVVAQDTQTEFGELYAGVPCQNRFGYLGCSLDAGTPVTVSAPATTTDIDFALSRAGSVAGRLTDGAGTPLGGVPAVVLDAEGRVIAETPADVLGDFRFDGLRPGTVYLGTTGGDDWAAEVYQDVPCPGLVCDLSDAVPLTVVAGRLTEPVQLNLERASTLTGRVTDSLGVGLGGATVRILTPAGGLVAEVETEVGGTYRVTGLAPADLILWARADGYRPEVHDGVPFPGPEVGEEFALANGDVVRPFAGMTTTIDFTLDRLAILSGSVRDADTMEMLVGSLVRIWALDGGPSGDTPVLETSVTVGAGGWSATLWPGTYAVATAAEGSYVDEVWDDVPCFDRSPLGVACDLGAGESFELSLRDGVAGVDFALEPAGSLAGVVAADDGTDAGGETFVVGLWSEDGALLERVDVVLDDLADGVAFGDYAFDDLAPGDYYLTVDAPPDYLDLAVGGSSCLGPCDPLAGTAVEVVGTDVALAPAAVVETCTLCLDDTLELRGGRFEVDVRWSDFDGNSGVGTGVPLTDESGYFWFFADDNVEMVIKVLDACDAFGRFWVFAAGLTNVEVEIDVTDTADGTVVRYANPLGTAFEPILDVDAFATCDAMPDPLADPDAARSTITTHRLKVGEPLSLRDGRFVVETTWRDFDGNDGDGTGVGLTNESGTFWFFDPANVEVIVKVLDACDAFDRYWVFAAGLTNVEVALTVTDTEASGDAATVTYDNPLGTPFQPILDIDAFATCP